MSDRPDQQTSGIGTAIVELFTEMGIVKYLQPGIVKAINHLMVGAADVPAAYFEGLADNIRIYNRGPEASPDRSRKIACQWIPN